MKTVDSLKYSMYLDDVEAHIITIPNHKRSLELSARCQESCRRVGQPYKVWEAFDGTSGTIKYPAHLEDQDHFTFLKRLNDHLTVTEVATILSHYSLWSECVRLDKPLVVLEHDAIMVEKYISHDAWNQIVYLGNLDQAKMGKWSTFPMHFGNGKNYRYICAAHAYAIDPASARSLVAHVIKNGLTAPADMLMRADLFPIIQVGFYAYNLPDEESTITGRDRLSNKNSIY